MVLSFDGVGVFDDVVLDEKAFGGCLTDVVAHLAFIIFAFCLDIDKAADGCSLPPQSISVILFDNFLVGWTLRDTLPSHE